MRCSLCPNPKIEMKTVKTEYGKLIYVCPYHGNMGEVRQNANL